MRANSTYEELLAEVNRLQDEGRLPTRVTREQLIDWAYGDTKLAEPDSSITMESAARIIDSRPPASRQ